MDVVTYVHYCVIVYLIIFLFIFFFSRFGYFIFISHFLYFIKIWSGIEVELHFKPKIMKFSYSFYI